MRRTPITSVPKRSDRSGRRDAVEAPPVGLSPEQRDYLAAARGQLKNDAMEELLAGMVAIPSATGDEATLARWLVERLAAGGLSASYQHIAETQGNAIGRLRGSGGGCSLLLYGHIDTHLSGTEEDDSPATRGPAPPMSRPSPYREGDVVFGLGAGNPKGYSAAMAIAALAIAEAQIPLQGDLVVGLAAGGMPTNAPVGSANSNIGMGIGCTYMLQQGVRPDFAVIGKPGHAVAWEEVGVCYFRIRVAGEFGYAGTRHILNYRNPIVDTARAIVELEPWLDEYARRNSSDYVAPQGVIGAMTAGWPHKPSFVPAWSDFYLDVRVSPYTDPIDVKGQLQQALDEIAARHPDLSLELEMTLAIPGTRTDPANWIIQSCIRAFEEREGRRHQPITATSGATDAEVLRMWGIPTARLGMASTVRDLTPTLAMDLDSVHLPSMARYVETLLYVVVDTCCRPRAEVVT